jgi:hypothetical protein
VSGGSYRTRQLLHTSKCALLFLLCFNIVLPTTLSVFVIIAISGFTGDTQLANIDDHSYNEEDESLLDVEITDDQASVMDTSRTEIQSIDTQPVDFEERQRDTLATVYSEISTDTNSVHFDGRPRYTCATRDQAISTGMPPRPPPRSERERLSARVSVQIQELSETPSRQCV